MTTSEIEAVARTAAMAVLVEQRRQRLNNVDKMVLTTVATILTSFGIEEEDRQALRQDFRYLRGLRRASEKVTNASLIAIVTILVGGFIGAIWLGIKALISR